ncbi:dipeptidyl-peptidase IV [Clostridium sp. BJN0001]|uniref:dipeptidyl-peptidase IV n=1 Tax=Clostridium sp. BJN0001 TaxID=2930219 RepID=UPI001FD28207|nr:dipeptidyl-peptidase IV [Clostridium sp. BJN0001]
MKVFKRLIAWAMISLVLQLGLLFFLDKIVFRHTSYFNSKKIELNKDKSKEVNASLPNNAESVQVSFDGKYILYYVDNNPYVMEAKTGEAKQIEGDNDAQILFLTWIPDRNRLAALQKVRLSSTNKVQLVTYNPKDVSQTEVTNVCSYTDNFKVNNFTVSSITGVYYIDVSTNGNNSIVYRIDINNNLTKFPVNAESILSMCVVPHQDRLIYQDEESRKFYETNPKKELTFNTNKNLELLGIDRQDVIYIGEVDGKKITSIIYGTLDENTTEWKKVNIDSPIDKEDVFFSDKSEIYVNDNLKGVVENITSGKKMDYEGRLIKMSNDFIALEDNSGKVTYKNISDKK